MCLWNPVEPDNIFNRFFYIDIFCIRILFENYDYSL